MNSVRPALACIIVLLLAACSFAMAGTIAGEVVGISDGDTLTVLVDGREPVKVRLTAIDTPESGQPFGRRAKAILSDIAFRQAVRVSTEGRDRYGRELGRVYVGDLDVNREMVRLGAAWVYREYSDDPDLLTLEAEARQANRGLWALPEARRVPPWEWRSAARAERTAPLPALAVSPALTCGAKRYCREMSSCEEARFHLNRCGIATIDGDADGVPCEGSVLVRGIEVARRCAGPSHRQCNRCG